MPPPAPVMIATLPSNMPMETASGEKEGAP
jgi:hypothetical protein